MAFDNHDVEPSVEEAGPPPSESSNRSFLIVAGILGALLLLSLICVAAYAFLILPSSKRAQATANAAAIARATESALSLQQTALAQAWTATPTQVKATKTPLPPTNTAVVVIATTSAPTNDPRTATIAALQTQAAALQKTGLPTPTVTALAGTGIADEFGIPGLVGLAVVLVAVIFLARRLRTAS
jgi:hypothetical protein